MNPQIFSQYDLQRAAAELAVARTRARTPSDWSLVRECERALTSARLQSARQSVAPLAHGRRP